MERSSVTSSSLLTTMKDMGSSLISPRGIVTALITGATLFLNAHTASGYTLGQGRPSGQNGQPSQSQIVNIENNMLRLAQAGECRAAADASQFLISSIEKANDDFYRALDKTGGNASDAQLSQQARLFDQTSTAYAATYWFEQTCPAYAPKSKNKDEQTTQMLRDRAIQLAQNGQCGKAEGETLAHTAIQEKIPELLARHNQQNVRPTDSYYYRMFSQANGVVKELCVDNEGGPSVAERYSQNGESRAEMRKLLKALHQGQRGGTAPAPAR